MNRSISRTQFAASAAATFAGIAFVRSAARGAPFAYRYGNDQTLASPVTIRAKEMWAAVERETGGKLAVETFPNSQLGGDSDMLKQLRIGAIQFLTLPGAILGSLVPSAQLCETAFAFRDAKQAFTAVDGDLGEFVRAEIAKKGLFCLPHPWDNGFREITATKPIRSAADLEGLKIRVPSSPLFIDLFKTLGASPVPLNVSELYTALQTHVVDAQENALINIEQSRIYEVQTTLNFSNHAWSCWWFLANHDAWNALGTDIQNVVLKNVGAYALLQRSDFAALTATLTDKLKSQGMQTYACDTASFRAKLGPYYAKSRETFGPAGWSLLEKYAGSLS
jgi:tripartite ATP-independent transporter DctP family solute receptor